MTNRRYPVAATLLLCLVVISALPNLAAGNREEGPHGAIPEPGNYDDTIAAIASADRARGVQPLVAEVPIPANPNRIQALSTDAVRDLETGGLRVVENRNGLRAVDINDERGQVRIAVFDAQTDAGTDVIALAFLNEGEVEELEEMQARASSPVGPSRAQAHYTAPSHYDTSHYHYFWNCSWVHNKAGSYAITWRMCGQDTVNDRYIGDAIALAMNVSPLKPLLKLMTGMLVLANHYYFYASDGSLSGTVDDFRKTCGNVGWYSKANRLVYYYCAGTPNFDKAWDAYFQKYYDLTP